MLPRAHSGNALWEAPLLLRGAFQAAHWLIPACRKAWRNIFRVSGAVQPDLRR